MTLSPLHHGRALRFGRLLCLTVALLATSVGCARKARQGQGSDPVIPRPVTNSFYETNTEGGAASALQSSSFTLSKGTVGGNYRKFRGVSSSFILMGGAIHAP